MRRGGCRFIGVLAGVLAAVLVLLARAPIVAAITQAEQSFLSLYFTPEELQVVTATRSLQSIARVAENITVVTAADIELMNAHTMEEVVSSVPGVTTNIAVQFVTASSPIIQGRDFQHVTVLIDGVPVNNLASNAAILGAIPVTDIEKVEFIKGPASSVWGSAMGGVINVVTRAPGPGPVQGKASLDYGTENTGDYRAAVSGRVGRLGYSLSGTNLRTDGLVEGFDVDAWHVGTRLDYSFTDRMSATFTLFYGDTDRGDGIDKQYDLAWRQHIKESLISQLGVTSALGQTGLLDLAVWTTRLDSEATMSQLNSGTELSRYDSREDRIGGSVKYAATFGHHAFTLGSDYSSGTLDSNNIDGPDPEREQWAFFANDIVTLGKLTIIPGLRFDDVSDTDSFWSPSLGVTYLLAPDTLLRATVARGFSTPSLFDTSGNSEIYKYRANPDLSMETMWSYQAGLESGILETVWLKVSAYRHDVEDALQQGPLVDDYWTTINAGSQRRQGLDLEMRTKPIHNFTLAASACFLDVEDADTGEDIPDVPKEIYDVSLKYDDLKSFRALLKGRDMYWDLVEGRGGAMSGFIVDLNLAKRFLVRSGISFEAFFTAHNLFDETQQPSATYPTPDRWYEGGIRASF